MTSNANVYYVYVYIDPRNLEAFYYGKGRDSRKDSHLFDKSDSEKAKRIQAIQKAGLEPIVRVVARDLSEHDALLVEKTLLWKLGDQLTNVSSGHYADNFRPHFSLHLELTGFDFQCGVYYYNVGEGEHRNWDDYLAFGFISAGYGEKYRETMKSFRVGDVVAAYFGGKGFVGIGQITELAKPVRDVVIDGERLLDKKMVREGMHEHAASDALCEYVARVTWLRHVSRSEAKWIPKSGLFSSQLIRASLDNQPNTIAFLEQEFDIRFGDYVR